MTLFRVSLVAIAMAWMPATWGAISFENVSTSALHGRAMDAESWGVSVGDYNGDHWLDIVLGNHRSRASLYRNNGDGTLSDVVLTAGEGAPTFRNRYWDEHMLVFGDVDGDGDDDVADHRLRRMWWSNNGLLTDSGVTNATESMAQRAVETGRFYAPYCHPQDLDEDQNGTLKFDCHYPARALTRISPGAAHVLDLDNADLNGDGLLDIIAARGSYVLSDVTQLSSTRIEAAFAEYDTATKSFSFDGSPPLTVNVWGRSDTGTTQVLNGSATVNGASFSYSGNRWTVSGTQKSVVIDGSSTLSNLSAMSGLRNTDLPLRPALLRASGGGAWESVAAQSGLGAVRCNSVVAADFDNDMDMDLYFGCRGGSVNIANILYENNGSGFFTQVPNAGGARGVTGGAVADKAGTTDMAVVADFDNDGFLDIFASNGNNDLPLRRGGPHELFINKATGNNNWIQLKLRGAGNDYDAYGARVVATAGGVSQIRLQDGGNRRHSSDTQRIHFGLANNSQVDLEITWPSGSVQQINNVAANTIYTVNEGSSPVAVTPQPVGEFQTPAGNDDCGVPDIQPSLDYALFLYQTSCGSNIWEVRVTPGSQTSRTFTGQLVATGGGSIGVVNPRSLEGGAGDTLNSNASQITFSFSGADNQGDGFQFALNGDGCLTVNSPAGVPILVGPKYKRLGKSGINPRTLAACSGGTALELSIADVAVTEAAGTASVDVSLSAPAPGLISVTAFTRVNGSATAGQDFYGSTQTVNFGAGQITRSVNIGIVDDTLNEPTETFTVRLTSPSGATIGDGVGVVSILDNDSGGGTPSLSVSDTSFDEGVGTANVIVSLSPAAASPVTVTAYTRAIGTATAGQDFYGTTRSLTFTPGQTSQTLPVTIVDDAGQESAETFGVRLVSPSGAGISTRDATITITDNDTGGAPVVSIASVTVNEGAGQATLTLTLSQPATASVVAFSRSGTAIGGGNDFFGFTRTVTFSGGSTTATVVVDLNDDAQSESTEAFTVRLANASGAQIGSGVATVTIIDND